MYPDRINKVANAIAQRSVPGLGFNMRRWFGTTLPDWFLPKAKREQACGTTACIAGWVVAVKGRGTAKEKIDALRQLDTDDYDTVSLAAQKYLGLDKAQASQLFLASGWHRWQGSLGLISPARAVAVLRHLAETGEVDWGIKLKK